jgi:nucleoside-diphosphate-sugar epimerase
VEGEKQAIMRVLIAGATGVLGRNLIRQFLARGHCVVGLARDDKREGIIRSLGGQSRRADIFDADSLARAAVEADVVIHAATSIPLKNRTSQADWEMNDRLRRDGTRALTACAARIGARLYLQQSITWVARPEDGSFFDEESPPHTDGVTLSALDGEQLAFEAGVRHGFQVSVLRCGLFYGPDSAHTKMFRQELARRRMPIIGSGDAVWSCIHTEDAANAFVTSAEGCREGLWHIVDDHPVKAKEFLTAFAERLGAPRPLRVPVWLARIVAGQYAVSFFTTSFRTSNARFRRDFGWSPRYPTYREGLEQIINAWRAEGPSEN